MISSSPRTSRVLGATVVATVACALLFVTLDDYGVTWDERLYLEQGASYADWWLAPSLESIDEHWRRAHPPLSTTLGGLVREVFAERLGWYDELDAHRASTVMFAFALHFFLFLFAADLFTPGLAVAVSAAFFCIPRVFFHAHLGALDYPVTALMLAASYAYWKGIARATWLLGAAFLVGLALAAKPNAALLGVPMGLLLALQLWERRRDRSRLAMCLARQIPMLVVPPLVFLAVWPWLWPAPFERFVEYLGTQVQHFQVPVYWFGRVRAEAPATYPFVMIAVGLPLAVLVPALLAPWRLVTGPDRAALAYVTAAALTPLVVLALPGIPKYDGVRLFLPALPFWCLLAGAGLIQILERLPRWRPHRVAIGGYLVLLLGSVIPGWMRLHPYEYADFNLLIGGPRGAAERGFDLEYWGSAVGDALPWIRAHPEARYWMPLAPRVGPYYVETGALPATVRFGDRDDSDLLLLLNRPGLQGPGLRRWVRSREPVYAVGPPGIELVGIYALP